MTNGLATNEHQSPQEIFEEGRRYMMGQGVLNLTLRQLVSDLDRLGIDYMVVGAVALLAYGYPRFTVDIDLLLTPSGLESFHREMVGRGYVPAFPGARKALRATSDGVRIDVITSGEFPGDGQPKPVEFPDPTENSVIVKGVRYPTLEKLIELKLASGMTGQGRLKDLADVQELIKFRGLDVSFAENLDPYVRGEFLKLLADIGDVRSNESE